MAHSYALFSARYRPLAGGVETFTQHLAHELVLQGEAVTVVTSDLGRAPQTETQPDGVRVVRLPSLGLMGGRLPVALRGKPMAGLLDQLLDAGIDRVLVNTRFYEHSIVGLEFAREAGAKAVVLDHGSDWLTLGNPLADVAIRAHERAYTRRCRGFSPRFAGISGRSCAWLGRLGVATDLVIPNAIDAPAFRASASARDFRRELGVSESQTLVAFCGRLAPEKGALELARAVAWAGNDTVLALAGSGTQERQIRALGAGNVHLLGSLSHGDVSALLRDADALCLPSRSEGFSTALLEAAAWGTPCVTTNVGGAVEVLGEGLELGVELGGRDVSSIQSGLALLAAHGRPGKCDQLRQRADDELSWRRTVDALERAFA